MYLLYEYKKINTLIISRYNVSSVREYVFYVFFQTSKNMTYYVSFERTYQKVVKISAKI